MTEPRAQWERGLVIAAIAISAFALAWLTVRVFQSHWVPIGDYMTLQLRVSDVGGSHTPLVGVYSRFDWNHPGPLLFYALALPYRLLGANSVGLLVGAVMVNTAAIGGSLWVAARVGRQPLAVVALFSALLCCGIGLGGLADPWNPYMTLLPMFATGVAAWRCLAGDRVAAIVLVVAGSFAVQSHVGVGPVILALVGCGVIPLGVRALRGAHRRHDAITIAILAGLALLLWLPAIVDQAIHSPGNLRLLFDFARNGRGSVNGFGSGARLIGRVLSIPGDWLRGIETRLPTGALDNRGIPVPWAALALVAATWTAWRRRWRTEVALVAVAWVMIVSGLVAASRVTGLLAPYLVRWAWVIGAFTWMAAAMVLTRALSLRVRSPRLVFDFLVAATIAALIGLCARGVDFGPIRAYDSWQRTLDAVIPPTVIAIADGPQPVVIRNGYGVDGAAATTILDSAERAGLDVRRQPGEAFILGAHRTIDPTEAKRTLVFATNDDRFTYAGVPGWTEIATYDPLTTEERAELVALEAAPSSGMDLTNLSPKDAADARLRALHEWRDLEVNRPHPSAEYLRYQRLALNGDILSVFISDPST